MSLNLTLHIWRQSGPQETGRFVEYRATVRETDSLSTMSVEVEVEPGLSDADAQAAVDLHRNARAQLVEHQSLMRLGQADFPRRSGMHN